MFIKALQKSSHAVVPQLNGTIVKSSQDPGPLGMERDALDAVALGLELEVERREKVSRLLRNIPKVMTKSRNPLER